VNKSKGKIRMAKPRQGVNGIVVLVADTAILLRKKPKADDDDCIHSKLLEFHFYYLLDKHPLLNCRIISACLNGLGKLSERSALKSSWLVEVWQRFI
jgi:hypothetical protein